MKDIILLAGPTASGKSALAMELSERLGGVVVNADALQVYRDLRIVTARPSAEDERRVPHRLYGHVAADESYSAGRWLGDVAPVLAEARRAGRVAIVTGGTGLYFRVLTQGLARLPPIPPEIRARWREEAARIDAAALHLRLAERDPEGAATVRPSDRARIVRALEVLEATGLPLRHWHREGAAAPLIAGPVPRVVLEVARGALADRIAQRLGGMIAAGAVEEVAALGRMRLDPALPIMKATGVRELLEHLAGRTSLEEAVEKTRLATAQYAKRQMTWFRNQMRDWERIPAGNISKAAARLAQQVENMN